MHVDRVLLGAPEDLANDGEEDARVLALEVLVELRDLLVDLLRLVDLEECAKVLRQLLAVCSVGPDQIQDNAKDFEHDDVQVLASNFLGNILVNLDLLRIYYAFGRLVVLLLSLVLAGDEWLLEHGRRNGFVVNDL